MLDVLQEWAHGPDVAPVHNETAERDVNRYADLVSGSRQVGLLSLRKAPEPASPRLHEILRPEGYTAELRLVLVAEGRYWGGLSLFRDEIRHPFTDADAEVAAQLAGPLCAAVRRYQSRPRHGLQEERPAGVVLVGPDSQLLQVSAEAQVWLDDLTSGGDDGVTVDDALRMVYEVAGAAAAGRPAACRVRTRTGRWTIVSAARTPPGPAGRDHRRHPACRRHRGAAGLRRVARSHSA